MLGCLAGSELKPPTVSRIGNSPPMKFAVIINDAPHSQLIGPPGAQTVPRKDVVVCQACFLSSRAATTAEFEQPAAGAVSSAEL